MKEYKCAKCGGALERISGDEWKCSHCRTKFYDDHLEKMYADFSESLRLTVQGAVTEEIEKREQEKYFAFLGELWKKTHATYPNFKAILNVCNQIKSIYPNNFVANFYATACGGSVSETCDFINEINVKENEIFIEDILSFMLKSLDNRHIASLVYLIERAYKNTNMEKFARLTTLLEAEAQKVEEGIYNTSIPRDVFVAYSSQDLKTVIDVVNTIEEQDLSCFFAHRNLKHGTGSQKNYEKEIYNAINNCKIVLFISSENSRKLGCDALKVELPYIRDEIDKRNYPILRTNYTDNKLLKYKMPRIEYRVDNKPTQTAAQHLLEEFFAGLEYCKSKDELISTIADYITGAFAVDKTQEEQTSIINTSNTTTLKNAKYCSKCGAENPLQAKLCMECGNTEFFNTQAEYLKNKKTRLAKYCSKCGAENPLQAKLCMECGNTDFANTKEEYLKTKAEKEEQEKLKNKEQELVSLGFNLIDTRLRTYTGTQEKVVIPDFITTIESHAFFKCATLKEIVIPKSVKLINDSAFVECNSLTQITIPNGTERIEKFAFKDCANLEKITIPKSVTKIGDYAFKGCSKLVIYTDYTQKPTTWGDFWNAENLPVYWNGKKETPEERDFDIQNGVLVKYNGKKANVKIPEGVTKIDQKAFYDNLTLESISIPEGVTIIGENAFTFCKNLTSVILPNSLKTIEKCAFYRCSSITALILPISLTNIEYGAFEECENLLSVSIEKNLAFLGESVFRGCNKLSLITVSNKNQVFSTVNNVLYSKKDKELIFYALGKKERVFKTPQWVVSIGAYAFCGSELTTITLPDNLKKIGNYAFGECEKLKNLVLPEGLEIVGEYALSSCFKLTEVIFPNSVHTIGKSVLFNCAQLKSVTLPNKLTSISEGFFQHAKKLENVVIPDTVTSIKANAFEYCHALTNINLPQGITEIGPRAFSACFSFKTFTLPPKITEVASGLFNYCSNLKEIVIPHGVKSIGKEAFYHCSALTEVVIPNSVTSIEWGAFSDCENLEKVVIPNSVTSIDIAFGLCKKLTVYAEAEQKPENWDNNWIYSYSSVIWGYKPNLEQSTAPSIANHTEWKDPNTLVHWNYKSNNASASENTAPTIPLKTNVNPITQTGSSVKSETQAENEAQAKAEAEAKAKAKAEARAKAEAEAKLKRDFEINNGTLIKYKGNDKKVVIPNSVTSIGNSAFRGCSSLTSITIPNSVTSIGNWAFDGCSSLTSITIPNSVTSIGNRTFADCSSLTSITIPNSVTSIGYAAFYRCESLTSITIPNSVTSIGDYAFYGCSSLKNITIPNSVTSIAEDAFYGCSSLTSITIPNSVTSIGNGAFKDCSSLTDINIPNSVTSIGDGAFKECSSLTNIFLQNSLKNIGENAFCKCISLKELHIPNGVCEIKFQTFGGCSSLTKVTIPNSVVKIEWNAFVACNNLTIYAEAQKRPKGWIQPLLNAEKSWNPNKRPVVWGYKNNG